MERGTYIDLTAAKRGLSIFDTIDDAQLVELLERASRQVDLDCGRRFYTTTETRYYTAGWPRLLTVDDLLSVSALATDDNADRTYSTAWTASDYELEPANGWPKWQLLTTPSGSYSFPGVRRGVRVTGSWGYGDGQSATPWTASGATLTVATANGTAATVSSGAPFAVGQTLLVETEQIYVQAVAGTSLTIERGVNGTTGAAHAAAASIARYPSGIVVATLARAEIDYRIPITGVSGGADIGSVVTGPAYARYRGIVEQYRLAGVA